MNSNEQLLWKRWSIASSGSPCATSFQMNGAATSDISSGNDEVFSPCRSLTEQSAGSAGISPIYKSKGRFTSGLQPPSLLDADVARQESQLWRDQGYSRQKMDDFSLSSEEEIYSLSALDSDEEDAYSYILDLHKEVFVPHRQLKSQVPRVEEETAEEINEESKHTKVYESINGSGCKHQDGSVAHNADTDLDSDVRTDSVPHRKSVMDKKKVSFRDMTNTRAGFDMEPDDESSRKEPTDEETVVRAQSYGGYSEEEKTEHVRVVTRGYDETEHRVDEAEKTKMFVTAGWQKEFVEHSKKGFSVKCLQVNEGIVADDKEVYVTVAIGKDRKLDEEEEEEEDNVKNEYRENQQSVNLNSLEVGGHETFDRSVYEVRGTSATRMNTDRHQDAAHSMEDFTNNSKDENKEEYTTEGRDSVDFDVGLTVEENHSDLKTKKCRFTDKKAATGNHPIEPTPKNDADGGVNIHDGNSGWTSGYSATSHLFR